VKPEIWLPILKAMGEVFCALMNNPNDED